MSVDPGPGNIHLPQTVNRYAYVLNSPLNYWDADGMNPCIMSYPGVNGGKPFPSDCTHMIGKLEPDSDWSPLQLQRIKWEMYSDPIFIRDPNLNIHKNVRVAESHRDDNGAIKLPWFYFSVRNRSPWDFEQLGRRYTKFGNFHYGLVGAAAGIPKDILLRAAGFAQKMAGESNSPPEWGIPFGPTGMSYAYGDDPNDQIYINIGYQAYQEDFALKP